MFIKQVKMNKKLQQSCLSVLLLFIIIILTCSKALHAAVHYVSPSGSASWGQSSDTASPCSTACAFANAHAGDTVYFRGGTYNVPPKNILDTYHGYYEPANTGTLNAPIVFMAYPGEIPVFNGTSGGSGDIDGQGNSTFATIFGTNDKSYITYDGFTFQANNGKSKGRIIIGRSWMDHKGNHDFVVKNCIFNGGTTASTSTDNCEGLRVEGIKHALIQGNLFFSYRQVTNNHNTSALKTYRDTFVTVEKCEFQNNTVAVYHKSNVNNIITRNNFIHNNDQGIIFDPEMINRSESDSEQIYQNLIINSTSTALNINGLGADSGSHGNDYWIYNNTFNNNGGYPIVFGYNQPGGHGERFYNNIITGNTGIYSLLTEDRNNWTTYISQVDHNEWGTSFKTIRIGDNRRNINYTTLASWKASGQLENAFDAGCGLSKNPGCGDLASDPYFINGSGSFNLESDFELASNSPCKGAGRNGADMGANIKAVGRAGYNLPPNVTNVTVSYYNTVYGKSIKKLQWNIDAYNKIVNCSLSVSLDSARNWISIKTVSGFLDTFSWTVIDTVAPNCFIKVAAIDDSGKTGSGLSNPFSIIRQLQIEKKKLINASKGRYYSDSLTVKSGIFPFLWTIVNSSLPIGLSLNSMSGVISGIPDTSGLFLFTVKLTDAENHTTQDTFSLIVDSIVVGGNITIPISINDTVLAGKDVTDTILVQNDTLKLAYSIFANRADKSMIAIPDSILRLLNGKSAIIANIPGIYINDTVGERAFIVVSNGTICDTISLSHPIRRDKNNCDNIAVGDLNWTPLCVTATPDSNDIATVLKCYTPSNGVWTFDKTMFRIIQWLPSTNSENWVEGTQSNSSTFSFTLGKLFWIKSKEPQIINFGPATVSSMTAPCANKLNETQWTDFSVPFNFPVLLQDVVNATKQAMAPSNSMADSLDFYQWSKSGKTWIASLMRGHGFLIRDTLLGGAGNAYTVYNPNASFAMQIPPITAGMSISTLVSKKAMRNQRSEWFAFFSFQNSQGDGLNPVCFGYTPGNARTSYLKQPPSFGNMWVNIYDPESNKFFGHAIVHEVSNGGAVIQLAFHNESHSCGTIKSFFGKNMVLPSGYSAQFFDPARKKWMSPTDTIFISVPANSRKIIFAGVGKQSFFSDIGALLSKFKTQLTLVYPNPCSNKLLVKYTVPYLVQDVKEISFKIFNVQGKTVWTKKLTKGFNPGENSFFFDRKNLPGGKFASGVYMLLMSVVNNNISENLSFSRQILFVY